MALTEKGFARRSYEDILSDKIAKAIELFGNDIDTSDLTPLGKFIRIGAYDLAQAEEEIENLYYSIFPNTATGVSLDRLCPFVGISRLQATAAQFRVEITGEAGTEIPYGFLVKTESEVIFYNTQETVIDETGVCEIIVECETQGIIGNVNPSEINIVVNPVGDAEVLGKEILTAGTDTEDDVSLRKRFEHAREGAGSCNENAITAALLRVETVTSAGVIANDTNSVDSSGRPAHSFECYVAGGELYHQQIAETIFNKKPLGIATHGKESVTITDESGTTHTIKFSHTTNIPIYVKVSLRTDATFEGETGKTDIINNISSYINTLAFGESVILSSLYGRIHAVTGVVEVTNLQLSTDGKVWGSANVEVAKWEKAICNSVEVA